MNNSLESKFRSHGYKLRHCLLYFVSITFQAVKTASSMFKIASGIHFSVSKIKKYHIALLLRAIYLLLRSVNS